MCRLEIDGIAVEAREGATILEAARSAGIEIPTLCHLREALPLASCRVCSVEVEGADVLAAACAEPVREGMVVRTGTPLVQGHRQIALELIVAGLAPGAFARMSEDSEFRLLCAAQGIIPDVEGAQAAASAREGGNPFLSFDHELCIRCQRCVGACNAMARNHTLGTGRRGLRTTIRAPFGEGWRASDCESCGTCAEACPTGALSARRAPNAGRAAKRVLTTCPHCAVGCQMNLVVEGGKAVAAEAADGPSNKGRLCVKGRFASFDFVHSPDRLTAPLVKNRATGEFEEASWDEALDLVASRFSELRDAYGGESIAAFACSRSTNEDVYLFQKMARTALGTSNVDNCARV